MATVQQLVKFRSCSTPKPLPMKTNDCSMGMNKNMLQLTMDQPQQLTMDQNQHVAMDQPQQLTMDQNQHVTMDQPQQLTMDQPQQLTMDQNQHVTMDQPQQLTKDFWRHANICNPKSSAYHRIYHQRASAALLPVSKNTTLHFREKILDKLSLDEISLAARNDATIDAYGIKLFRKCAQNKQQFQYVKDVYIQYLKPI
ncbi:hypothetical protein LOTGIDRAFT_173488 [Lottia gigantea]|uniref:Uncharacterized protein n=1 Tax=Lottia gigantea TaxID=225164 RepID=V4AXU3_LOTGI|nr:hypothetical protein LOTGIDRAFT_173488 [Lottia gigantea]ESO99830.1 hypothetical protein LOTGIDRAFT_173488 [Lottia gigantea]